MSALPKLNPADLTESPTLPASRDDDEDDLHLSGHRDSGDALPTTKHLRPDASLREVYEFEREQLIHRYATKFPNVMQQYAEQLKHLYLIQYTQWGGSVPMKLPEQNGKPLDVLALAVHVMKSIMDRTTRIHQDDFLRMFEKLPSAQHMVQDLFWYFFIDIMALAETEKRFNSHRLDVLKAIKGNEHSRIPVKKSRRTSTAERSRSFLEISGKLQSAEAHQKRVLTRKVKDRNTSISARLAGGRLNFGSSSEEEDEATLRKMTGDERKDREMRKTRDMLRTKFEARQNESYVPPHVLTPRDVTKLKNADVATSPTSAVMDGRGRRSPGGEEEPTRPASVASCGTAQSMPDSAFSGASTPRSHMSSDDGSSSLRERSSEMAAERATRRMEACRKSFYGELDLDQAATVLKEAEELDYLMADGGGGAASPLRAERKRAAELSYHAIQLIRREQHRMFGRMSDAYVHILRAMKPSQQNVMIPKLPDVLARMVVQVLYAQVPYARDLLTRKCKKRIKKKISYWITGIADPQVDVWASAFSNEVAPLKARPAPVVFNVPKADASVAFAPPPKRRGTTVTVVMGDDDPDKTPEQPSLQRKGVLPPKPPGMKRNTTASSHGSSTAGAAPAGSDPITHLQRHGGAIFPRAKRGRQTHGERTPAAIIEATFQDVPVVTENNADGEYRRAFDELASDFDRLQRGESVAQITGSSHGGTRGAGLMASKGPAQVDPAATMGASGYESKKKKEIEDPRHVENHRHAACNKRAELWHEYGRPNHHVSGQVNPLQLKFDLRTVSPFMQRFLVDKGVTETQAGLKLLMKWSS